ncbi:MAG: HAMP domain-containing sensor histidine kinase [Candidatus Stygibacter frigidus]|nr:HAMP domain-containing sensor histidine kinase [Candidatus Stygibacter frigidus]
MSVNLPNILQSYLFREASVFLLLCTSEGKVLETNDHTRRLLGFDPAGSEISEIFVNFDGEKGIRNLLHETEGERLFNVTTFTGLPQSLYFKIYEIHRQILFLGRNDAEEQEFMRKEIVELNNEMSRMARQLHKQKSELEKLNKLKDQFLGMAAHDLRKPVGLIMNYADFLVDDLSENINAEDAEFLARINRNALYMREIINDFLDVALIEAGQFNLNLGAVDLNQFILNKIAQHKILASKYDKKMDIELSDEDIVIDCDASKLEQVINNLVSNAIEHSGNSTEIKVILQKIDDQIIITVKDNGKGISYEQQAKLFDIYARSGEKKTGSRSTGLGLAITKKIIEAHQGEIKIESEPGKGASFIIKLPDKGIRRDDGI